MQVPTDLTKLVDHFDERIMAFEEAVARMIAESEKRVIAAIDGADVPTDPDPDPDPVDPPPVDPDPDPVGPPSDTREVWSVIEKGTVEPRNGIEGVAYICPGRDRNDTLRAISGDIKGGEQIKLTDITADGFYEGISVDGDESNPPKLIVDRAIIRNSHDRIGGAKSQGIFTNRCDLQLLNTIIDHCGWLEDADRTKFAHGVYMQNTGGLPLSFYASGCYFGRNSAQGTSINCDGVYEDCIFDLNAVGAFGRWRHVFRRCVFLRGVDIHNPPPEGSDRRGWGIQIDGDVELDDCVFALRDDHAKGTSPAIRCSGTVTANNVRVHKWMSNSGEAVHDRGNDFPGVFASNNPADFKDATAVVSDAKRNEWLTRPRGQVPDIKAECARLLEAYSKR
jgi:hypothetical protein